MCLCSQVFEAFDADKDDNLNPDEFYNCTTGIGLVLSEEEVCNVFWRFSCWFANLAVDMCR